MFLGTKSDCHNIQEKTTAPSADMICSCPSTCSASQGWHQIRSNNVWAQFAVGARAAGTWSVTRK